MDKLKKLENYKLDDKSDEFKWYFLRGAIDGDGCVGKETGRISPRISLCSASTKFVKTIVKIFGGKPCKSGSTYNIEFRGAAGLQLAKKLPVDSFCLTRKTQKILESIKNGYPYKQRQDNSLKGSIWRHK